MLYTHKQVIDFLIAQGKPLAHAKVAVHESFNYDDNDPNHPYNGLCIHAHGTPDDPDYDGDFRVAPVTEELALQTYDDMCGRDGYFKLTNKGFVFGNDEMIKFDLNGNINPNYT